MRKRKEKEGKVGNNYKIMSEFFLALMAMGSLATEILAILLNKSNIVHQQKNRFDFF